MIRVERATEAHARAIAPRLTFAGYGRTEYSLEERSAIALRELQASIEAWTWLDDERPVAMAGVIPRSIIGGIGWVWLLVTPEAFTNVRAFWRASKAVIAYLSHSYSRIEGRVDVEFVASVRWLRHLGFTVHGARVPDDNGRTFHFIERKCA